MDVSRPARDRLVRTQLLLQVRGVRLDLLCWAGIQFVQRGRGIILFGGDAAATLVNGQPLLLLVCTGVAMWQPSWSWMSTWARTSRYANTLHMSKQLAIAPVCLVQMHNHCGAVACLCRSLRQRLRRFAACRPSAQHLITSCNSRSVMCFFRFHVLGSVSCSYQAIFALVLWTLVLMLWPVRADATRLL